MEFRIPDTHHILVTNDGSELTALVVKELEAAGNKVVVLDLPNIKKSHAKNVVSLGFVGDQEIAATLDTIRAKHGKTGSFIHLHPHFEFEKGNFTQHFNAEREIVKIVFFLAKHVQKDLNELGRNQRAAFLGVTRLDGKLGQGKRGNTSIIGGGLPGLIKCLNLEWSPVFCRAVDIQPELPMDSIAKRVIAEMHDANTGIIEVAISEDGRRTTVSRPTEPITDHSIVTTVTRDSVFLVSGGARGVTANCVVEMARAFKCKFILLGRSTLDIEVPSFATGVDDEATLKSLIMNDLKERGEKPSLPKVKSIFNDIVAKKEIDSTIAQIESNGSHVAYLQGDVTDLKSFKNALAKTTDQLGPITGIIHGAGRLADKYIQDKTENDFENVISVKLDGLLSLLRAVDLDKLDHLILFSSVAGFYGNVGQTDYAIANEILSRAAHLFKTNHPKTHVSAINWGAWDSGMVSGQLKAQFEEAGITLVNSEGGAAMLVNEFNSAYADQPQVIIGGTLPAGVSFIGAPTTHRIRRKVTLAENPFLQSHVIQKNPVLPVVSAIGWMAQCCEDLYPDFATFKIENAKLFKGVVFDGEQTEDYVVEIKEMEKSADKIVMETTVFSEGKKLPTFHYKATVTLVNKRSIPTAPKFEHKVSGKFQPTAGAELYMDGSLFHGKHFQGIKKILDYTDEQIVLACKAPEIPMSEQGQFPVRSINTYFADIQYQGMLVWAQKKMNGVNSLPLQTDRVVQYRSIPFGKEMIVNISIKETSEVKVVAECTVYDEEGTVYAVTSGAVMTISKQLVW